VRFGYRYSVYTCNTCQSGSLEQCQVDAGCRRVADLVEERQQRHKHGSYRGLYMHINQSQTRLHVYLNDAKFFLKIGKGVSELPDPPHHNAISYY